MLAEAQIRQQIFQKVRKMPSAKLNELNEFLNKLEQATDKTTQILSYAGSWNALNNGVFEDFTDNLVTNRSKNSRRIDE